MGRKLSRRVIVEFVLVIICIGMLLIRPIFQWINQAELTADRYAQLHYYGNVATICIDGVDFDGVFRPGLLWWDYRLELLQYIGLILLGVFCIVKYILKVTKLKKTQ